MHEKVSRAERYRVRAEEVRVIAASMVHSETRRILQSVADEYEHMAGQIERMNLDDFSRRKAQNQAVTIPFLLSRTALQLRER